MRTITLAIFALLFCSIPISCYVCCYLTKKGKITWGPTPEPLGQRNPQWRVDYNSMVPNSPSKFLGDQLQLLKLPTCSKKGFLQTAQARLYVFATLCFVKKRYDNSQKASLIDFWKKCITGWTHLDLKVCQEKDHGAHKIFHFNKNMRSTLMQG